METFAKEPKVGKIIAGVKTNAHALSLKKFTGISRMSVTASLLCFGCFAAEWLVNVCFFAEINVYFYWLA